MATDIVIDDRFTDLVTDVIRKHFPDIRQYIPRMDGLVKTKLDKEGESVRGSGPVVTLKRTPPIYGACGVSPYLMVIDGCYWHEAPDHDIRGMIGNALLSIEVEVITKKGVDTVRFRSRKPDLVVFTEAVRMFGAFMPAVLKIRDIAQGVASAALGFVEPRQEEPEEEPAPPSPKPKAKAKAKARVQLEPTREEEEDKEWPEPSRVRSADEVEREEALLSPARSS